MKDLNALKTIQTDNDYAIVKINPKIYNMEIIYSAAYILIDKAFIILDGDPEKEVLVEIRKKNKEDNLEELIIEFNEELLNYAVYINQANRTNVIREILLNKALGEEDNQLKQ